MCVCTSAPTSNYIRHKYLGLLKNNNTNNNNSERVINSACAVTLETTKYSLRATKQYIWRHALCIHTHTHTCMRYVCICVDHHPRVTIISSLPTLIALPAARTWRTNYIIGLEASRRKQRGRPSAYKPPSQFAKSKFGCKVRGMRA